MTKKFKYYLFSILLLAPVVIVDGQQQNLSLSDAINRAMENNYGIVISNLDSEVATINNNWGTAGRYPTISFSTTSSNSADLNNGETKTNRIYSDLGLRWTIFNGFTVNITKEKLEQIEELSKGGLAVIVESTIEDVILAYYQVLLQQERLNLLERVMKLSEDRYNYEQKRYELGGSAKYNMLLSQNTYLNDKGGFLNQEVLLKTSIRNLNFLMGVDSVNWKFTQEFNADSTEYIFDALMQKMMSNNQTLQNQYTNLLLSQKEIELKKAAMYPSLSLSTGVDNTYLNTSAVTSSSSTLSAYGNLSLSYNIFAGGNRKRAIEIAKIDEQISQTEIEEMKHSLTNQLLNLYDTYNVRITLLHVANESLAAAELNLQLAEDKYKTGAINSFNYRDIQVSYLNTALQRLQAIYNLVDSHTALTRITGGFVNQGK